MSLIFNVQLILSRKHGCLPKLPFFGMHLTLILSNRAFDLDILFSLEEIKAIVVNITQKRMKPK